MEKIKYKDKYSPFLQGPLYSSLGFAFFPNTNWMRVSKTKPNTSKALNQGQREAETRLGEGCSGRLNIR